MRQLFIWLERIITRHKALKRWKRIVTVPILPICLRDQCAELNCEASGALYQDVITIPGTQMYWSLYHRARGAYDKWKLVQDKTQNRETDTMYVVAMPKDLAEKYDVTTQEKVLEILKHVHDEDSEFHDIEIVRITTTNGGNGEIKFSSETDSHIVPPTYFGNLAEGQTRTVYDSGTRRYFRYGNTDWHYYTGNFSIPENQYLTRFFFVAGKTASESGNRAPIRPRRRKLRVAAGK